MSFNTATEDIAKKIPTIATAEKLVQEAAPKFATIFEAEFTYKEGGVWHKVEVNAAEYLEILRTGEVDGRQICALSVCEVKADDGDKIRYIYDFILLHTSRNPWRMS